MLFLENLKDLVSLFFCGEFKILIFTRFCFIISSLSILFKLESVERWPSHISVRRNDDLDFAEVEELVPYCDY